MPPQLVKLATMLKQLLLLLKKILLQLPLSLNQSIVGLMVFTFVMGITVVTAAQKLRATETMLPGKTPWVEVLHGIWCAETTDAIARPLETTTIKTVNRKEGRLAI